MTHTVDITDIRNMVVQQVLASAYNKILLFEYNMYDNAHCWKVIYSSVKHNNEEIYHNLTDAVDAYNALR